jgi:hypothetical protein
VSDTEVRVLPDRAALRAMGIPDPAVFEEQFARMSRPDYPRWDAQLAGCGYCVRPVRLRAILRHPDGTIAYSTAGEPDGVLLKRCGNRRQSVCPACSFLHRGDDFQVFAAGIAGGRKGVPESVADHPMAFVTLTAPSFGPVHGATGDDGRCRPRHGHPTCPHGRPVACNQRHNHNDHQVGQPLCPGCYHYDAAVLFNYRASELWRRFTIALCRALAAQIGVPTRQLWRLLRLSFAKVAEMQRRAAVHYHAVIRLDRPGDGWQPPQLDVSADQLEAAIRTAAAKVRLQVPEIGSELAWGDQVDVQPISRHGELDGELTAEKVAVYLSKYVVKSGPDVFGLDGIVKDPDAARRMGANDHIVAMMAITVRLAERVEGLGRWTHMLGFRGHIQTKSRMFSTTLGAIQTERVEYQQNRRREIYGEDTTLLFGEWTFDGIGHLNEGDRQLAAGGGQWTREAYIDWRTGGP